jgi:DNA polymerase III subunit epsilon
MKEFIAIDFETANPSRVSACSLGYTIVRDHKIIESKGYLIKPIGGHADFQSKIHGIKHEHTFDKPEFGKLFPNIQHIFEYPLISHSLFDKQVLTALSDYFNLRLWFNHIDSCAIAKEKLPDIKNHKLETLVKHFDLPKFKHHDATEDSMACARVFLKLFGNEKVSSLPQNADKSAEFNGFIKGILADEEVNYKEAYTLLYWLEENVQKASQYQNIYLKIKTILEDDHLDKIEALELKLLLGNALEEHL